jgi:hypothetical protein
MNDGTATGHGPITIIEIVFLMLNTLRLVVQTRLLKRSGVRQ